MTTFCTIGICFK